jgi:hypothetical protein
MAFIFSTPTNKERSLGTPLRKNPLELYDSGLHPSRKGFSTDKLEKV